MGAPSGDGSDRVVAVVLAAGAGTRFGGEGHKLLAPLPATAERPAEAVAHRSIGVAAEADVGPLVVVTGAVDVLAGWDAAPEAVVGVAHPGWERGQRSSLLAGLEAAARLGGTRVVVGLADQPGVTAEAWRTVAAAGAAAAIAVATYAGRRGNPVSLDGSVWHLLEDGGDEGARGLMRVRPDLVHEVPCSGSPADVDTVEDLARWQNN